MAESISFSYKKFLIQLYRLLTLFHFFSHIYQSLAVALRTKSGICPIVPDGERGLLPYYVTCDMSDKGGVGVTVISHDSENRTLVDGYEAGESYSRNIHYKGANISQLVSLINVPQQREQFIKYECLDSTMHDAFWVSRESIEMNYRGGAAPDPDSPMKWHMRNEQHLCKKKESL